MSISTPQGGGSSRQQAKKAVAGGKPNESNGSVSTGSAAKAGAGARSGAATTSGAGAGAKAGGAAKSGAKAGAAAKRSPGKAAGGAAKPARGAGSPGRPGAKGAGAKGAGAKGAGRRPITPVRVSQGRNWGPIALFSAVILLAVGIVGFAGWQVYEKGLSVSDRVDRINGVVNWREKDKDLVKGAQHVAGKVDYAQKPPVAGKHNKDWQNCMGDIYDAPIANEHAVHSLEHGAVWITYDPAKVNKEQIDALAAKIQGKDYSLMSPVEGLPKAVSVQAWGFQLQVDNPKDKRIDEFIKVTRKNASVEPGVACSGGITETGTTPRDLPAQQQPAQPGG
jgi:hypothetical protein